jgi:cell division protein FtsB
MTEDSGHLQLLMAFVALQTIFGAGLWWAIKNATSSIENLDTTFRIDHVHLPEFEALRAKVDRIAETQASIRVTAETLSQKVDTLDAKIDRVRELFLHSARGDNPGQT